MVGGKTFNQNETTHFTSQTLYYLIASAAISNVGCIRLFAIQTFPKILILRIIHSEIILIIARFSFIPFRSFLRKLVKLIEFFHSNCNNYVINIRLSRADRNLFGLFILGLSTVVQIKLVFIIGGCALRLILDFVDIIFIDIT